MKVDKLEIQLLRGAFGVKISKMSGEFKISGKNIY